MLHANAVMFHYEEGCVKIRLLDKVDEFMQNLIVKMFNVCVVFYLNEKDQAII